MEKKGKTVPQESKVSSKVEKLKFDPSDYLPRRTSRASAQAASQALKRALKEEKTDPGKADTSAQSAKKTPSAEPEKRATTPQAKKDTQSRSAKASKARKRKSDNCFVKLVSCESDPTLKPLVSSLREKYIEDDSNSSAKKIPRVEADSDSSDPECLVEEVKITVGQKTKNNKSKKATGKANGKPADPDSKYQIVYAPTFAKEQQGLKHISKVTTVEKKKGFECASSTAASSQDLKVGRCGPKVRQASSVGAQKSVSVVMVHPKPGSKIINESRGRESKSVKLQEMIADPDTVIKNEVSRVMTTGGNFELHCNLCSMTFLSAGNLINHKRMSHKVNQPMCTTCGDTFASEKAQKKHACSAKYRCDICGIVCKQRSSLAQHRRMAHRKTLGEYMCYVCCFNASTMEELNTHRCGGKPSKLPHPMKMAASSFMVYPKWDVNSPNAAQQKQERKPEAWKNSNIYINISGSAQSSQSTANAGGEEGADEDGMKFLCERCLNVYPSSEALDTHKCVVAAASSTDGAKDVNSPAPEAAPSLPVIPNMGGAPSSMPVNMEIIPEVEQLAKFYSSVVFSDV